ncbi:MAG: UDP-glucose/GDP-mannose dehydrogenase family protein [Candidatus Acidiferrales bacterium]
MRIAVVGSGYVGLVSAACFAEIGHEVISVDNDAAKIAALERGEVPIHERFLPELLTRHRGGRLRFSTSVPEAVQQSDAVFITVGTPQSETGEADLSFVEAVAYEIATAIHRPTLVIEKSTVPVRTCDSLRKTLLLNGAKASLFSVASNPEFLREGTAVTDFLYPDRIVIGADDKFSVSLLQEIYRPLTSGSYYSQLNAIPFARYAHAQAPIIVTNAKSAELIKHASNAFLAMKISFINAVANISEAVGADIQQVCSGIGSDSRIGPKFLNAGIGYGGSCFPKDVQAFHAVATQCGYDFGLLTEVMNINLEQRRRFLKKVRSALWTLRGKQLGILGLAFKGDTDDIRESPAIAIINSLLKEGAQIRVFDPAAKSRAMEALPEAGVFYAADAYDAAAGCDALLILTEWKEFASLDLPRLHSLLKYPIVIDGRNLYDPEQMTNAGLMYHSIGRATGVPQHMSSIVHHAAPESQLPAPVAAMISNPPAA